MGRYVGLIRFPIGIGHSICAERWVNTSWAPQNKHCVALSHICIAPLVWQCHTMLSCQWSCPDLLPHLHFKIRYLWPIAYFWRSARPGMVLDISCRKNSKVTIQSHGSFNSKDKAWKFSRRSRHWTKARSVAVHAPRWRVSPTTKDCRGDRRIVSRKIKSCFTWGRVPRDLQERLQSHWDADFLDSMERCWNCQGSGRNRPGAIDRSDTWEREEDSKRRLVNMEIRIEMRELLLTKSTVSWIIEKEAPMKSTRMTIDPLSEPCMILGP